MAIEDIVCLDTTGRDFLGFIDKILIKDSILFALDRFQKKQIYAFNSKNGKFLFNVGKFGDGPGSYEIPYDFIATEKGNKIEVLDVNKIHYYNSVNGEYIESRNFPFSAVRFIQYAGGYGFAGGGNEANLFTTDKEFNLQMSYFPFKIKNAIKPYNVFQKTGSSILFQLNFENTIYEVTENSVIPYWKIDFGQSGSFKEPLLNSPAEVASKYRNKKLVAYTFFESNEFILFAYIYHEKPFFAIYSKTTQNKKIIDVSTTVNDLTVETPFPFFLYSGIDNTFIAVANAENIDAQKLTSLNCSNYFDFAIFKIKIKPF